MTKWRERERGTDIGAGDGAEDGAEDDDDKEQEPPSPVLTLEGVADS